MLTVDTLTHLLIGYLLGFGLFPDQPALVALVTVMAVLPDVDTLCWAFPRLIPSLRHRGQTHSLTLGLPAVGVAASLVHTYWGASWQAALLGAFVGWASHLVLDLLNWGCAILWPFNPRRIHYTVQWGLRGPMVASAASLGVLLLLDTGAPRYLHVTTLAIGALWTLYLLAKLAFRLHVEWRHRHAAEVTPTAHPLVWTVWDALPTNLASLSPGEGRAYRVFGRDREA